MRAGRLNKRVTIETLTETVDGSGQAIKSWSEFARPWASIDPINGREYFSGNQVKETMTVKIKIRYQSGITNKMRVNHGGKLYNIEGMVNIFERDKELILLCSEGTNDG